MIDTISYFSIVEAGTENDVNPFKLTSTEFTSRNDCNIWLWDRAEDLQLGIESGSIAGVVVKETKVAARFLVVGAASERARREVPRYLWFGARILQETEHYFIVGIPTYYADSQAARLHSGMHYCSSPLSSLEEAELEVRNLETLLVATY